MAAQVGRVEPMPAGLSRDRILEIYYYLVLARSVEERLVNLYRQGRVVGGLYRSLGQEGESVASAYALEPGDILSPLIRNLGSILVRGARPVEVLRQYMAKGSSPTGGREMNVHFNDLKLGYLGQISHLGDMIPVMAGIALSFKMRGERRVGLAYIGDGGTSTGAFHEGINLAAAQRVPLVIMVEHNGWAYSTPTSRQMAVSNMALKAKAYGIPAHTVDGNDVLAVYEVTKDAVARARDGGGVTMLEVMTCRGSGHAEHDDQRYQPQEDIEECAENDPIVRFTQHILAAQWVNDDELSALRDRVHAELDEAVETCEHDPPPDPKSALTDVLANPSAAEELWFRSPRA
jgi:pyruvate dehydrogenase E1 component alpha subunit/2-oxoisovalerate dehydrogenase E1 component alpha subunit